MAKSKAYGWIHERWYDQNTLRRRTFLVMFCALVLAPTYLVVAAVLALFSLYYIPSMVIMHGASGYNEGMRNLHELIMVPLDLQMEVRNIWLTHWDRLPEK